MSGLEAGYRYPDLVRAGIHLVLDPPADVPIRVDPDGERKWEERHRRNKEATERHYGEGASIHRIRPLPPLKTIHLQWYDTSYEPVWRDTHIHIDLEKKRFHQIEGWLIGRTHQGSGAIGVMLFAAPVLLAISPYLYVRARLSRSKERKHGMSRHGIMLMDKLKGQLDAETEALLRATFENEWKHDVKVGRRVSFKEAGEALSKCDLTERRMEPVEGDPLRKELLRDLLWFDDEGDMIGHAQFIDRHDHMMHVLGSTFEGEEAQALTERYRSKKIIDEDP